MTCFRVFISASVLFFALIIGLIVYENKYMNVDTIREGVKARIFATMLANMQAKLGVLLEPQKQALFKDLEGTVAEIGSGTGANFKYIGNKVEKLIAIEPNLEMFPFMRESAKDLPINVELVIEPGIAQNLTSIPDNSLDAVLLVHVLCTISARDEALIEIKRVLKRLFYSRSDCETTTKSYVAGGKLVFLEHVGDPVKDSWRRAFQNWLTPLWKVIGEGCEPNRDTLSVIEKHFNIDKYEYFELGIHIPLIQPHIMGSAVKN